MGEGFPIVLCADRTLTAGHRLLFDGMVASSQTSRTPWLLAPLLAPRLRGVAGRAARAPLGLRRIEAALLRDGLESDAVAVVDEDGLDGALGPATRAIGISTGEPLGHGMSSSTFTAVVGGRIWPERCFQRLFRRIQRLRRRCPRARVVLGGPGAWQVARARPLGIDCVVSGYAEGEAPGLFRDLLAGREPPALVEAHGIEAAAIPAIRGASTMGAIESSRGCGLGCGFCTLSSSAMRHLAPEQIEHDALVNLRAGQPHLALLSEDLFRWRAVGLRPEPGRVLGLLHHLRSLPGLGLVQPDHANLASTSRFSDFELGEVRRLLSGPSDGPVWLNVGVETPAGALLAANGGVAKMAGCRSEDWGDFCRREIARLVASGFFPLVSLVMGLPGEEPAQVEAAVRWTEGLEGLRLGVFPVRHAPLDGGGAPVLHQNHWRLMQAAYRHNFRHVPGLYQAQLAASGASPVRRALLAQLGRGQVLQWRSLLAWRRWWAPV